MPNVRIETASPERIADLHAITSDFLNSKRLCCLFPLGKCDGQTELLKNYNKTPDKFNVGAIAYDDGSGEALGMIQCALHGHYCDLHKPKENECYVDWLAVLPNARGMGVGTKLLKWAEEKALARGCTKMTLGVINGNPAINLYLRTGYEVDKSDPLSDFVIICFTLVCFGRPYGCCHPNFGSSMMTKSLGGMNDGNNNNDGEDNGGSLKVKMNRN